MVEILVAWLPLIVLLGFFGFIFYKSKQQYADYKNHVEKVNSVNQQIVETNREMIAELKEIKNIVRDRK